MTVHSVEQTNLLLMYLSVVGIWVGLPGVSLYLKNDKRWPYALAFVVIIIAYIFNAYLTGNKTLFPDITLTDLKN